MPKNNNPRVKCPKCGSSKVLPIVYGLPIEIPGKPEKGLIAAEKRGEVELGGCVITGKDPNFRCKDCGEAFR
jgi:DNA-directed RNA polymerase subunit RPC12/RpoP